MIWKESKRAYKYNYGIYDQMQAEHFLEHSNLDEKFTFQQSCTTSSALHFWKSMNFCIYAADMAFNHSSVVIFENCFEAMFHTLNLLFEKSCPEINLNRRVAISKSTVACNIVWCKKRWYVVSKGLHKEHVSALEDYREDFNLKNC